MNSLIKRFSQKPILLLLAVNILAGLFVFRDYGLSWDEPLFYDYGDALGYAYSPHEWLSGHFDVSQSYGSSGDDHKTRGPAYLLLAREPVYLLEGIGLDKASAWHLINFLFFQIGVYFLYRLASRWMKPSAALAASALFSWQPLLWGHAFINPKDPSFLIFFLSSVCLGFEMVDHLADDAKSHRQKYSAIILPAVVLGITTSIRVLGPLAGLLILVYAISRLSRRFIAFLPHFIVFGLIAILVMFITWPFLWEDPIARFVEVFRLMSDNPTDLSVLFGGVVYRAGDLPRRYMPFMLATTLTEPVWFFFSFGVLAGYWKLFKENRNRNVSLRTEDSADSWRSLRSSLDLATIRNNMVSLTLIFLWLVILVLYVLVRRPSMYDGLRHFLFILPPIFIFTGFGFEFLIDHIALSWLRAGLILLVLIPGIVGIIQLHPYEYTYYNSFVGGTSQVFRQYETDYWLTCYKEAVENLDQSLDKSINLFVHREAYVAAYYADPKIHIHDLRGALTEVKSGDYVLVNTRTNEDRRVFREAPPVLQIARGDALFCIVKQIP
ncbi:MAG TPA: hypothetical protein VK249_32585 [Anaerolineales bacterium]|nr:hypothetical protein [Anaerolineales bacterium]